MPTVYLAGPIRNTSYEESTSWRDVATEYLSEHNITAFSPMRSKEYLKGAAEAGFTIEKSSHPFGTISGITGRDRNDVTSCNLLLVNLQDAKVITIGTMIELGWADMLRKPIVVVMDDTNVHWHPMVRGVAGWIVPTLEEALLITESILLP